MELSHVSVRPTMSWRQSAGSGAADAVEPQIAPIAQRRSGSGRTPQNLGRVPKLARSHAKSRVECFRRSGGRAFGVDRVEPAGGRTSLSSSQNISSPGSYSSMERIFSRIDSGPSKLMKGPFGRGEWMGEGEPPSRAWRTGHFTLDPAIETRGERDLMIDGTRSAAQ